MHCPKKHGNKDKKVTVKSNRKEDAECVDGSADEKKESFYIPLIQWPIESFYGFGRFFFNISDNFCYFFHFDFEKLLAWYHFFDIFARRIIDILFVIFESNLSVTVSVRTTLSSLGRIIFSVFIVWGMILFIFRESWGSENVGDSAQESLVDSITFSEQEKHEYSFSAALSGLQDSETFFRSSYRGQFLSAFSGIQESHSVLIIPSEISGDFSEEFSFIRSGYNLLALDIRNEILIANNRFERFEKIDAAFQEFLNRGNYLLQRLQQEESQLKSFLELSRQQSNQFRDDFSRNMNAFNAEGVNQAVLDFTLSDQNIVQKNAELARILRLENFISPLLSSLQVRQQAMQNNRDALLAGVQMDAQTARSLGLFFEQEE